MNSAVVLCTSAEYAVIVVKIVFVKQAAHLCCTVSKLGQDFGSVVRDDAHGVTGQVQFLQTGQRADVPDLLQL